MHGKYTKDTALKPFEYFTYIATKYPKFLFGHY